VRRAEVRDLLRELIELRQPGEVMPSERSLSEQLGVSRPTLRAAIDDLARDGLLIRQHGRGTFTSPRKITQPLADNGAGGFTVLPAEGSWQSTVVEFRTEHAGARLGRRLEISPGDEVVRVLRLRTVDGTPMAIEKIRIPVLAVPGISRGHFEAGSLYEHLRSEFGIALATAVQTTEPTVTDAAEADLLGVPLLAPALLFERVTRDRGGRVVEYTRSVYRGDRYRLTTHLDLGGGA
jgi:GntR family transcriptional regulator